eukprot:14839566-Alexandrium_andersonii.AAC.1
MSASLVGSEMCIRDRSRLVSPRLASPRLASPRLVSSRLVVVVGCWCHCCLLYTSDAADDM